MSVCRKVGTSVKTCRGGLLLLALLVLVPNLLRAQKHFIPLQRQAQPIDCGFFWDPDHGFFGSGIRTLQVFDTSGNIVYAHRPTVAIYRTTDGGATITPCVVPTGFTGAVTEISFVDRDTGYASIFSDMYNTISVLWKTTDGGANWFDLKIPSLGSCVYAAPGIVMYTTWDGNDIRSGSPGGAVSINGKPFQKMFRIGDGIAFTDSLHGVVTELNQPAANFWTTKDAGVTWQRTADARESWGIYALKGSPFYVTANESLLSGPHSEIFWSTDYGLSWSPRYTFPLPLGTAPIQFTGGIGGVLGTLYFQTDETWVGPQTGMYRSDDTGHSWKWLPGSPSHSRDTRFVVTGCTGEVVYCFDSQGNIFKTIDGGDGTLLGGNPNYATMALNTDSIGLVAHPCGDNLYVTATATNCVWVTIDSIRVLSGRDLFPTKTGLPIVLHGGDSVNLTIQYLPSDTAKFTGKVRVYAHAGSRNLSRDLTIKVSNVQPAGVILSRDSLSMKAVGCSSAFDTVYFASLGCDTITVDSIQYPQGEWHFGPDTSFTVNGSRTTAFVGGFYPDSGGVHNLSVHVFAHSARRSFDTILRVRAEALIPEPHFSFNSAAMNFATVYCHPTGSSIPVLSSICDTIFVDSSHVSSQVFTLRHVPKRIASGATDSVVVDFSPSDSGAAVGTVTLFAHTRFRTFDTVIALTGFNATYPRGLTMSKDSLVIATAQCSMKQDSIFCINLGCDDFVLDSVTSSSDECHPTFDTSRRVFSSTNQVPVYVNFVPDSGNTRTVPITLHLHRGVEFRDTTLYVVASNAIDKEPLQLSADTLYLKTYYCEPTSLPFDVLNRCCGWIDIDSAKIIGDTLHEFSFEKPIGSTKIQSLQQTTSGVVFTPQARGRRSVQVQLFTHVQGQVRDTVLHVGANNITAPELYLPRLDNVVADTTFLMPLMLMETTDTFSVKKFAFHLTYNTDILTPRELIFKGTLCSSVADSSITIENGSGGSFVINLNKPVSFDSDLSKPLCYVKFRVTLAKEIVTMVRVDSFGVEKTPSVKLCTIPETPFTVSLLCGNPTIVGYMKTGKASLDQVSVRPNPVVGGNGIVLSYNLNEAMSEVRVAIVNARGEELEARSYPAPGVGQHSIAIPLDHPSGDYHIVIRTPDGAEVIERVVVTR